MRLNAMRLNVVFINFHFRTEDLNGPDCSVFIAYCIVLYRDSSFLFHVNLRKGILKYARPL